MPRSGLGRSANGHSSDDQRLQARVKVRQRFLVEARPHVAGPPQLALFVHAQHQRAEMKSRPPCGWVNPPMTNSCSFDDFDLQPLAAAPGFVAAGGALGDDALQAVARAASSRSSPAAGKTSEMRSCRPGVTTDSSSLRRSPSAHAAQIVAVQVEQVEDEIDRRSGARQVRHGVGIGVGDARLDQVEARHAFCVEHRDFAIEHGLARRDVVRDHRQLGILPLAAQAAARLKPELLVDPRRRWRARRPTSLRRASRRRAAAGRRGWPSWARWRPACRLRARPSRAASVLALWRRARSAGTGCAGLRPAPPGAARRPALPHPVRRAGGFPLGFARRQVAGDLFLGAAGKHAVRVALHVPTGGGELVALLDDQPLVAFAAAFHEDQREIAVQLLAVQAEFQIAARQLALGATSPSRSNVPRSHSITLPAP